MRNQLTLIAGTLKTAAHTLIDGVTDTTRQLWERHLQLVNDRPGYRPAIVAGIAALLVLLDTPPLLTAAILAAMGVQANSHTGDRWGEDDSFAY
jgi:DMSO/TMAO reductase YedYZ heme-binding membrane subunit